MTVYNEDSHITSMEELRTFFYHLAHERHINFHPDTDFRDYTDYMGEEECCTREEARTYNRLMKECFEVCEQEGEDIYAEAFEEVATWIDSNTIDN